MKFQIGDKVRVHEANERYAGSVGKIALPATDGSSAPARAWYVLFDGWKEPQTLYMFERELEHVK